MRRFLLFILAVLCPGTSSGLALNYHCCMSKLAGAGLLCLDTCPSCGEAGTSHKCRSIGTGHVKLSVDQDVVNTFVQLSAPVTVVLLFDLLDSYKTAGRDEITRSNPFTSPPKENSATPLFVHYCTFLTQRYGLPLQKATYICSRTSTGVIYCEYWSNPPQALE